MGMERLDRRDVSGLLSESPIETIMTSILEDGPGLQTRAGFYRADGWRDAFDQLERDPSPLLRHRMVVFPQISIRSFRADFLVVVGGRGEPFRSRAAARHAFIIECDGREYHSSFDEDRKRESLIRRTTGVDVLRFSGPEILYRRDVVSLVIGSQAEALAAVHEFGWESISGEAGNVLRVVSQLSSHFQLRQEYTSRNSKLPASLWHAEDPTGEQFSPDNLTLDFESDAFISLKIAVACLRHQVAQLRLTGPVATLSPSEDGLQGGLQPIGRILVGAIEKMADRYING